MDSRTRPPLRIGTAAVKKAIKKACIFWVILALAALMGACAPVVTRMEITQVPEKSMYIQYYDTKLDLSGGKIKYYFVDGHSSVFDLEGEMTLKNNVNFNVPGTYQVYLESKGENTSFDVRVIAIDEADWLDPATREKIKAEHALEMDKAAIKTVIDKYLGEIYALRTKHSKKDLESGIVRIMPLLDEGSPYFYKCSAVLTMDYYYRLATGGLASKDYQQKHNYKYIDVNGKKSQTSVLEDAGPGMVYGQHVLLLNKKNDVWVIANDFSETFQTSGYYDDKLKAGLTAEEIVAQYLQNLQNAGS